MIIIALKFIVQLFTASELNFEGHEKCLSLGSTPWKGFASRQMSPVHSKMSRANVHAIPKKNNPLTATVSITVPSLISIKPE